MTKLHTDAMVPQAVLRCTPRRHASEQKDPVFLHVPPSKSVANRAVLLASLAHGTSYITPRPQGEDCKVLQEILGQLGVLIHTEDDGLRIEGRYGSFPNIDLALNPGHAGTVVRPLVALLCGGSKRTGFYRVDGSPRMRERPIQDLLMALRQAGARITCLAQPDCLPLMIHPTSLQYDQLSVSSLHSSQFISSLLMACGAHGGGSIQRPTSAISVPYIDMTLHMMEVFGLPIRACSETSCWHVSSGGYHAVPTYVVERDLSNASYLAAGAILSHTAIYLPGVRASVQQGDWQFFEYLKQWGALCQEDGQGVHVQRGPQMPWPLPAFDIDATHIPDAAMTLAILALSCRDICRIRGLASWRLKECDRLAAMTTELNKLGAKAWTEGETLYIQPASRYTSQCTICTYQDHRMAMCFSLLSAMGYEVLIQDPRCVAKTYPGFYEQWSHFAHCTLEHGSGDAVW